MSTIGRETWLDIGTVTVLTVVSATGFWAATRQGIGVSPDTLSYFDMIHNPWSATGYPPGYSLILALFNIFIPEDTLAARWANTVLLIISVALIFAIVRIATRSRFAGSIAALLVAFSPKVLEVFANALSDSAFIVWVLLTLLALSRYLDSPARPWALLVAGLAGGMALLTRFAGVPLIAVFWTSIWLYGPFPTLAKLRKATFATLLSCVPLALWFSYGKFVLNKGIQQSTGRKFALLGNPDLNRFLQGFHSLDNLFLPSAIPASISGVILIAIVIGSVVLLRRYILLLAIISQQSLCFRMIRRFPMIAGLFICWYAAFLVTSVFIEANLPLYIRYMVPIYVAFIPLVVIAAFHVLHKALTPMQFSRTTMILAIVLAVCMLPRTIHWGLDNFRHGNGYTSVQWRTSELIAKIRTMKPGVLIYSNGTDAIYFMTGRKARMLPHKSFQRTGLPNAGYQKDMKAMEMELRTHHGVLVYFRTIDWRFYLPSEAELQKQIPLRPLDRLADGVIYYIPTDK